MIAFSVLLYFGLVYPVIGLIWGGGLIFYCCRTLTRLDKEWHDMVQCRGCGKVGWDSKPFCKECGIKGPFVDGIEMEGRCVGCGTLGEVKSRCCPNCGESVNESQTTEGILEKGEGEGLIARQ